MSASLALGLALVLGGLTLTWLSFENRATQRRITDIEARLDAITDIEDIEARLDALDARQSRLQRIVEKGWSQSLDLTSFDWRDRSKDGP